MACLYEHLLARWQRPFSEAVFDSAKGQRWVGGGGRQSGALTSEGFWEGEGGKGGCESRIDRNQVTGIATHQSTAKVCFGPPSKEEW